MKKQRVQPSAKRPLFLVAALLLLGSGWLVVSGLFAGIADLTAPDEPQTVESIVAGLQNPGENVRGNIYDRRGTPVAVSLPLFSIYVKPVELTIGSEQSAFLAAALEIDPDSLEKQLKSERSVAWLARYVSPQIAEEVRQQKIHGLYLLSEPQRYYPLGESFSHVVGCFKDGHGLSGIEFSLDQVLQGSEQRSGQAEPGQNAGNEKKHVVLQLDAGLQKFVERKLVELKNRTSAKGAWAVVMQPENGAVLAMASLPAYDPNRFWEFSEEALVNRVEQSSLAIGSWAGLFKVAEILDRGQSLGMPGGSLEPEKKGAWRKGPSGDFVSESLSRLLAFSPAVSLGQERIFPGEEALPSAQPKNLEGADDPEEGFETQTNILELLRGFAALVNGGRLPVPHMVKAVYATTGGVEEEQPSPQRVVLKPETSGILRALLTSGPSRVAVLSSLRDKGAGQQSHEAEPEGRDLQAKDDSASEQHDLFDAVMLGYSAGDQGDQVLAIALQDGSFAVERGTQDFETLGDEILRKTASVLKAGSARLKASSLQVNLVAAYDNWRKVQEKMAQADSKTPAPVQKELMPQVTGLSLRKALHLLQPLEVPLSVDGSGVVVAQKPKPGQPLKNGMVSLRLQPQTGSIRSM